MITLAQLSEIEAGCDGVTPGPWLPISSVEFLGKPGDGIEMLRCEIRQVDASPNDKHSWPFRVCKTVEGQFANADKLNFEHIARLDPATVRELVRLARIGLEADAGTNSLARLYEFSEFHGKQYPVVITEFLKNTEAHNAGRRSFVPRIEMDHLASILAGLWSFSHCGTHETAGAYAWDDLSKAIGLKMATRIVEWFDFWHKTSEYRAETEKGCI